MKIYTRTGDDGTTGLYFGGRVAKNSARPRAYGDVDELQAALGIARSASADPELHELLIALQHDLWVAMADLATAEDNRHKLTDAETRVTQQMIDQMEPLIDQLTERFEPPTGFVVPGATATGAALDLARTIARRAERSALDVGDADSLVVTYLNRMSDLIWTMARWQDGTSLAVRNTSSLAETRTGLTTDPSSTDPSSSDSSSSDSSSSDSSSSDSSSSDHTNTDTEDSP